MMESKDDSSIDGSSRVRKFGLPNWMMNNIEKLNFVTDFEQYACSPPESEGFLTDRLDSCDFYDNSESSVVSNETLTEKPKLIEDKGITGSKSSPNLLATAAEKMATLSVTDNFKREDLYSSPDTTPCATPEPSPAPRRRMSGQQDTVRTNPGRWFYMGDTNKSDHQSPVKGQYVNKNKENRKKSVDKSSELLPKFREAKPKKSGIKLVISNFDINAISPSSW